LRLKILFFNYFLGHPKMLNPNGFSILRGTAENFAFAFPFGKYSPNCLMINI